MLTVGTFIMVYRQTGNRVIPTPQDPKIGDKIVKTFKNSCVFLLHRQSSFIKSPSYVPLTFPPFHLFLFNWTNSVLGCEWYI